jgi:2-iminoacetate synthase ThiH
VTVRASDVDVVSRLLAMRGNVREIEVRSGSASGTEHLRLVAVTRLVLRDVRLVVPAREEGLGAMQVALHAGADHVGAVGRTGDPASSRVWIIAVDRQIREAGFVPVREGGTTA